MGHLVLNLPQPQNRSLENWKYGGHSMNTWGQCQSTKQLQNEGCAHYMKKLQVDAFSAILDDVTECDRNKSLPGSSSFCKNDIFDQEEKCMFNSTKTLDSANAQAAQNAQLLANLLFTGCDNSQTNDP